jgi:hypothetical protein
MTGSQIDQEVAGMVSYDRGGVGTANLDTPPTQELPVPPAAVSPGPPRRSHRHYSALVAAVRDHEVLGSHPAVPKRPADHALYAALDELESMSTRRGARPRA